MTAHSAASSAAPSADLSATASAVSSIQLGRVTVLPTQRRVLLDGEPARLGGRAFDLLQALLTRRGEVVRKEELLEAVWPGVVVEENNLEVQVHSLRKLLGAGAIITVPGRGYAFDPGVEVRESRDNPASATARRASVEPALPLRGRASEAAALAQLLRQHRIVTVTGPGGVGKSRLVAEVVAQSTRRVARADLAAAPGRIDVAASVGRALALGFAHPPTPADLAAAVASESPLIVIENAEHVIDQAGDVVEELASASGARVVCTSQVPLKTRGEHVLRLATLRVPESDSPFDADSSPALDMLLDTVRACQSRDSFTPEEKRDAAAICRHLDGLPVAIELAGARIPLLGTSRVRRMLADRFQLLSRDSRGTAHRHHSLLACLEWSWRLLAPAERAALSAVSQHPGRFTLGTARHALARIARNEWDAMELLGALVDKSMVVSESRSGSAFRVLENTRLFAQSRGAETAVARRAPG
jgi:predicted ATPase/DNA-binding winged helix-turn-helix (wHTH) protein